MNHIQERRLKEHRKKNHQAASIPSAWAMSNRKELLAKDNAAESRIARVLTGAGIVHTREFTIRYGGRDFFIDFAVETLDGFVAVEVDGKHHMTPRGQANDRAREKSLFDSNEFVAVLRMSWSVAMKINADELWRSITGASKFRRAVMMMY